MKYNICFEMIQLIVKIPEMKDTSIIFLKTLIFWNYLEK